MKITNIDQKLSYIKTIYNQNYQGYHISQDDFDELKATYIELTELLQNIKLNYKDLI